MTRGEKVIAFITAFCKVPEGTHVGKPLILEQFQKDFILDIYDGELRRGRKTRRAILSIARKNGKSGLIAALILVHLVGPEAKANSQIVSGAMSRDQAALVFDLSSKMVNLSPELSKIVRIIPSGKRLIGLPMSVEYKALAAEGKTAHGLSPVVAILDETGQVSGSQDAFVDAIITSQGAHESPLLLVISTQAANDTDLLSLWIDDAKKDDETVCHVYAADKEEDVLDESAWYKANPALGKFRSLDDMRQMAEQANRMPSFENSFRNLYLNQRISMHSPFISKNSWVACAGEPFDLADCGEIYGGLDLSARTDLTAFVLLGSKGKEWSAHCWFWTPEKGLHDRAKRDRAPYDVWVNQGLIRTTVGASIEYESIAREIAEITEGLHITAIAFDRWRMDVLKKEFNEIGLELPLVEWGQGFKDMSPAVDDLEDKILNNTLRHGANPVLTMCANNATIIRDPAGNRKIDKTKSSVRIDGIVALAMAAGVAERMHETQADISEFINNPLVL